MDQSSLYDTEQQKAARKIQAFWRGYSIRRLLQEICSEYNAVVGAIDGQLDYPAIQVCHECVTAGKCILRRPRMTKQNQNCCFHDTSSLSRVKEDVIDEYEDTFTDEMMATDTENNSANSDDESVHSAVELSSPEKPDKDPEQFKQNLIETKRDLTMELVWVQQAIESRRNYLQIKEQIA
ncbi:uncharacterized protein LOC143458724 [Clavelina lepadiformis]|uniref:uncharacterized protein LOC143458724 n=1 Tax=Clavelina lepadiformis TaxID=159417 RepID=UPI0040417F69